jgi:hypothetical protein
MGTVTISVTVEVSVTVRVLVDLTSLVYKHQGVVFSDVNAAEA